MNGSIQRYKKLVWLGVFVDVCFALALLSTPRLVVRSLGLREAASTLWVRNVGVLLIIMSLFNAGAARDPYRYPLYSSLVPVGWFIAAGFNWMALSRRSVASSIRFLFDLVMAALSAWLLLQGLSERRKRVASIEPG